MLENGERKTRIASKQLVDPDPFSFEAESAILSLDNSSSNNSHKKQVFFILRGRNSSLLLIEQYFILSGEGCVKYIIHDGKF